MSELAEVLPYNGYSHNLRSPVKGFRRGYAVRRQTAKAARSLGPQDEKNAGRGLRDRLVRDSVWFRGLLGGVRRTIRSPDSAEQSLDTQVFVNLGPVDSDSATENLKLRTVLGTCI